MASYAACHRMTALMTLFSELACELKAWTVSVLKQGDQEFRPQAPRQSTCRGIHATKSSVGPGTPSIDTAMEGFAGVRSSEKTIMQGQNLKYGPRAILDPLGADFPESNQN